MLAIRNEESACFWAMDLQLYITFVHTLFSGYAGMVNFNAEVWGNINGFIQDNRRVPKAHERESLGSRNIIRVCMGILAIVV